MVTHYSAIVGVLTVQVYKSRVNRVKWLYGYCGALYGVLVGDWCWVVGVWELIIY